MKPHQCLFAAFMIAVPAASGWAAEAGSPPNAGATQVARLASALEGSIDPKLAQELLQGPCEPGQSWSNSSVCDGGGIGSAAKATVENRKIVVTEPYTIVVQHFEGRDRTVYGEDDKFHHKEKKYDVKIKDLGADFVVMTPVGTGTVLIDKALYQQADPKAAIVDSGNIVKAIRSAANAVHSKAQAAAAAKTAQSISDNLGKKN